MSELKILDNILNKVFLDPYIMENRQINYIFVYPVLRFLKSIILMHKNKIKTLKTNSKIKYLIQIIINQLLFIFNPGYSILKKCFDHKVINHVCNKLSSILKIFFNYLIKITYFLDKNLKIIFANKPIKKNNYLNEYIKRGINNYE